MFTTAEVRWIFPGRIPSEVHDWFLTVASVNEPPARRIDKYLVLPGVTTLGIKLRQQRLEIKLRSFDYGEVQLHERVSGHMQRWQKWSLGLDQEDDTVGEIMNQGVGWLDVHKERYLSRYIIERKTVVKRIEVDDAANSGCEVELTAIEAIGRHWWTVAFESFGEEYILGHNLARVSESILGTGSPPSLAIARSCSYPQWLPDTGRRNAI